MKPIPSATVLLAIYLSIGGCGAPNPDPASNSAKKTEKKTETPTPHNTDLPLTRAEIPTGRLPQLVQPLHYEIDLTLLPERPNFSGTVDIDIDIPTATDRFYLHGRHLEVNKVRLIATDRTLVADYQQIDDSGVAEITLAEKISGRARLHFEYQAPFNQALDAAYIVKANDESYVFTQFEAIAAREVFPGFDEPAYKTPFDLSLVVEQSHKAIANTPQSGVELLDDNLKRVHFATTKPLPTYLIAFAVGDFDVVDAAPLPVTHIRDHELPLRAITVKGRGADAHFALAHTRAIVEALETYFGIPYPYAKLDLLALPDFAAGAMENAAAITYRDSLMLVRDDATPQIKRRFFVVHAHELSHQWFGDLVTPVWWDDIWLNEAFATWMSHVALDLWQPEGLYRRTLRSRTVAVMNADSKISARQIRQPVRSSDDIANAFDGITYSKGAAVISMFESMLGRAAFQAGVQAYLHQYAWGNASADSFIAMLAAQADQYQPAAITAAFHSFLEQPGLPLIQAKLQCDRGVNQVLLSQSRYLPLGSRGSRNETWKLPLCLKTGTAGYDAVKTCLLLTTAKQSLELPNGQCPDYLMPNAEAAGYYRWALDDTGWQRLLANIDALTVEEKMSLLASLDGAFNAGTINIPDYLAVAQRLANEKDWRIATAPMAQLTFIYERLANKLQRQQLQHLFNGLYGKILDRIGMAAPADNETAQFQARLVDFLAHEAKLPDLRATLDSMAQSYTGYPGAAGIYPAQANTNLVATALTVAVQDDDAEHRFASHLKTLALASDDAVFRNRALNALGHTSNANERTALLQLVFSPQLRDNEIYNIFFPQLDSEETREASWQWLQHNFDAIAKRVPDWRKGRLISAGSVFCDASHRAEVNAFFAPMADRLGGGPRTLASTLESIDLCMAKAAFHKPGLTNLINKQAELIN